MAWKTPTFWYRERPDWRARLLSPLGYLYGWATRLRMSRIEARAVDIPVIGVGNLTAGGTGKTPVALALERLLARQDRIGHFLTRGYGGRQRSPRQVDLDTDCAQQVGDEALLLARQAPTWVARNRFLGAVAAQRSGAQVLILDDSLQHPRLKPSRSLLVIDGEVGFGNRQIIPAGPLRETISGGLERVDAIILIGDDQRQVLAGIRKPTFTGRLSPLVSCGEDLYNKRVIAFAGIGRPEKFFATCRQAGAEVILTRSFADHHWYSRSEVADLSALAKAHRAQLVTTAKDAVRLTGLDVPDLLVLEVAIKWDDNDAISRYLNGIFSTRSNPETPER